MRLPRAMLRHTMLVEPYLGASATGPVYGPAAAVACYVDAVGRSVRAADGRVVVGGDKVIVELDRALAPECRVTVDGRVREVVQVSHYESRVGAPDHTELIVQ